MKLSRLLKANSLHGHAVADVTGDQTLALALAPFIVPPASITFGELADTYEYSNPFKKDED